MIHPGVVYSDDDEDPILVPFVLSTTIGSHEDTTHGEITINLLRMLAGTYLEIYSHNCDYHLPSDYNGVTSPHNAMNIATTASIASTT